MERLLSLIKDVPDFPSPGIVFKDFTPLLADPAGLSLAVELMVSPYRDQGITAVVGAESRGFIFGTAIAQTLSAGFIPIRKPGKLPRPVHGIDYVLEYGTDRLEIHQDALSEGQRVLVVDDLIATGGTMEAAAKLTQLAGAEIVGLVVLIELEGLAGRALVEPYGPLHSIIRC